MRKRKPAPGRSSGGARQLGESIGGLAAAVVQERKYGVTTFRVEECPVGAGSAPASLDAFVGALRFQGLGDDWREIDRPAAREILEAVLHRDLAYGVEMMTPGRARELAEQFLELFSGESRFFTNGVFKNGRLSMYSGITGATFDTGVVCLDPHRIGLLWVQDED
jgi:hypothetical protein